MKNRIGWRTGSRVAVKKNKAEGVPGGLVVKNLPANAGDTGLIPGGERPHMLGDI